MHEFADAADEHETDVQDARMDMDYRFTLSNERTFLAWIRTALALLAAGVGVRQVSLPVTLKHGRGLLSDLCVALAVALVALAYRRWHVGQRAMRHGTALPPARTVGLLTAGVLAIAVLADALITLH